MTSWFTNMLAVNYFRQCNNTWNANVCCVHVCMYKFIFYVHVCMDVIIFLEVKSFSVISIHFFSAKTISLRSCSNLRFYSWNQLLKNCLSVKIKPKKLILLWKLPWGLALFRTCHLYYFLWALLSGSPLSIWKLPGLFILFELLYSDVLVHTHSCWYVNGNHTRRLCFVLGEKRFQTIQDLVADGLITMYIDTYAKDYVDTMMISPVKAEEKKDEGKAVNDRSKENNEIAKDSEDGSVKNQVWIYYHDVVYHNFIIYFF